MLLGRDKTTKKNALSSLVPILGDTLGFSRCPGCQVSPFHFWMNVWYVFFHSSVRVTCILLFNKKHIIPGWLCTVNSAFHSFTLCKHSNSYLMTLWILSQVFLLTIRNPLAACRMHRSAAPDQSRTILHRGILLRSF